MDVFKNFSRNIAHILVMIHFNPLPLVAVPDLECMIWWINGWCFWKVFHGHWFVFLHLSGCFCMKYNMGVITYMHMHYPWSNCIWKCKSTVNITKCNSKSKSKYLINFPGSSRLYLSYSQCCRRDSVLFLRKTDIFSSYPNFYLFIINFITTKIWRLELGLIFKTLNTWQ